MKKVVNVLHRDLEIFEPQLKRELRVSIKAIALGPIPYRGHGIKKLYWTAAVKFE